MAEDSRVFVYDRALFIRILATLAAISLSHNYYLGMVWSRRWLKKAYVFVGGHELILVVEPSSVSLSYQSSEEHVSAFWVQWVEAE